MVLGPAIESHSVEVHGGKHVAKAVGTPAHVFVVADGHIFLVGKGDEFQAVGLILAAEALGQCQHDGNARCVIGGAGRVDLRVVMGADHQLLATCAM